MPVKTSLLLSSDSRRLFGGVMPVVLWGNPSHSFILLQSFVLSGLHSLVPIVIIRLSLVFINDRMTLKVSEESPSSHTSSSTDHLAFLEGRFIH